MDDLDEKDGRNIFQRHAVALSVGSAVLIGLVVVAVKASSGGGSSRREAPAPLVNISLPPPPPPPPPPPQPTQPPEQKMVEQSPVNEPEEKPRDEPPKVADPGPIGTNIKGNGPGDGFGLGGPRGNGLGNSQGGRGGGSRWGWYAGQVQVRISDALRSNRKTRNGRIDSLQVRIWPDQTGRIVRAQLAGTTGDPATDEAIKSEVLTGLQLTEAPPQGMPLPIVLRLNARRPQ
jgi:protein TonB